LEEKVLWRQDQRRPGANQRDNLCCHTELNCLPKANFPKAKKIVLVQDNLNTHKPSSLQHQQVGEVFDQRCEA
jgi:hypothetical protein